MTNFKVYRRKLVEEGYIKGLSVRDLTDLIERKGVLNPRSGRPFSHVTIQRDIKVIRSEWKAELDKDRDDRILEILIELKLLKRQCWSAKKYNLVRKILRDTRDILGLDAPKEFTLEGKMTLVDRLKQMDDEGKS